jgi:glutamate dehydrogenase
MPSLTSVLDIVEVAGATGRELDAVMSTYFRLGSRLELNWLRDRIMELPRSNRWQALARAALRDDLLNLHRALTREVLDAGGSSTGSDAAIDAWSQHNGAAVERCLRILADIKASRIYDTTTMPVALREVRNLIRGGSPSEGVADVEPSAMAG